MALAVPPQKIVSVPFAAPSEPPTHRRVDEERAAPLQYLGEVLLDARRNGRAVDHDRTLADGARNAVGTRHRSIELRVAWNACQDEVGPAGRLCRRACPSRAECGERLLLPAVAVVDLEVEPGGDGMACHRCAHRAESDDADGGHARASLVCGAL